MRTHIVFQFFYKTHLSTNENARSISVIFLDIKIWIKHLK